MPFRYSNTYGAQTVMSNSILNIAGVTVILPDEDAIKIYSILKDKGVIFSEYSSNIDAVLEPLGKPNVISLAPAPKDIAKNVAAAKAIGASYHDFMRSKSN